MGMGIKLFNSFLRRTAAMLLGFAFISSIIITFILNVQLPLGVKFLVNIIFILLIISFLLKIYSKRNEITRVLLCLLEIKKLILYVILLGFIIRLLWIVLVPAEPVSDFAMMYNSAKDVHNGNFSIFHGVNYFARFAHDTVTVIYYSLFYNINDNPIFYIRLVNTIFSTVSIFLIYLTVKQLLDRKSAAIAAVLLSFFTPFIMYNSQMLSENIALPFYLASIYFFIKYAKGDEKYRYIIFCGLTLSAANLFRMVGTVFLIGYITYFLIYKGIRSSIKTIPVIILTFVLPMYIASSLLISHGVTETQLWKSKEPFWTSILKGTNVKSRGYWNDEDARLPDFYHYDTEKVKAESIKIIKERLLHTPVQDLAGLFICKLASELGISDFFAFVFTVAENPDVSIVKLLKYFQLVFLVLSEIIYLVILYFSIFYLRKVKTLPDEIYLFLILLGGFVLLYLISEVQARYTFIICWVLIIFAAGGIKEKLYETAYKFYP